MIAKNANSDARVDTIGLFVAMIKNEVAGLPCRYATSSCSCETWPRISACHTMYIDKLINVPPMIAFFSLFLGILGVLCIWFRGDFWSLVIIIGAVFIFGYGCYEFKHMEEEVVSENVPSYHTDFVISFNLLFPFAVVALLISYKMGG